MPDNAKRILIVGAGAVGTVYGHFLQSGGADVTFFVRPKVAEGVRAGRTVYPLNRLGKRRSPVRYIPDGVVTDTSTLSDLDPFDHIWLCISSPALRAPSFVADLSAAVSRHGLPATWVLTTPGLDDESYLAGWVPHDAIVRGTITLVAYQAPLPNSREKVPEPGVAYYIPPGGKQTFSGSRRRARGVGASLVAGGCAAKVVEDTASGAAMASAVLMPYLLALELAGWSFETLKARSDLLALAAAGGREATVALRAHRGESWSFGRLTEQMTQPWLLRFAMTFGVRMAPFDLEAYFAHHFSKVRDQTLELVARYLALGEQHARPTEALSQLLAAVNSDS